MIGHIRERTTVARFCTDPVLCFRKHMTLSIVKMCSEALTPQISVHLRNSATKSSYLMPIHMVSM